MPGLGTGSRPSRASRNAITTRNKATTVSSLCAAKREKMLSARRKNRSEMRGMKIAGSTKSRASRMVTVGSVSQAGAEKSIDGLENHRDQKQRRVILISIVVESGGKSAD